MKREIERKKNAIKAEKDREKNVEGTATATCSDTSERKYACIWMIISKFYFTLKNLKRMDAISKRIMSSDLTHS